MASDQRTDETGLQERIAPLKLIRELAASGLAAAAAGLLVGGVGGRLAMRLSGFLNPDLAGRLTEARQRVGEITATGTVELLVFGGLLTGLLAAVPWVALRPWLPTAPRPRALMAAVAAVAILGGVAVEADNFDFSMLKPAWLHVATFTVLVGAAGSLTSFLDTRFVRRLGRSEFFSVLAVPMLGLGVLAVSLVDEDGGLDDVVPGIVQALVGAALIATLAHATFQLRGRAIPSWLHLAGRVATFAAVAIGLFQYAQTVLVIL